MSVQLTNHHFSLPIRRLLLLNKQVVLKCRLQLVRAVGTIETEETSSSVKKIMTGMRTYRNNDDTTKNQDEDMHIAAAD